MLTGVLQWSNIKKIKIWVKAKEFLCTSLEIYWETTTHQMLPHILNYFAGTLMVWMKKILKNGRPLLYKIYVWRNLMLFFFKKLFLILFKYFKILVQSKSYLNCLFCKCLLFGWLFVLILFCLFVCNVQTTCLVSSLLFIIIIIIIIIINVGIICYFILFTICCILEWAVIFVKNCFPC